VGPARLVAAFLAATDSGNETSPALEADLARACERGRAAFPGLAISDETFVRHLGEVVARDGLDAARVLELAVEDLFLASACLVGAAGAADALRARHAATVRVAVERYVSGPDAAEIEQQLFAAMLVPTPEAPARLASYGGRAPLDRWLQVAAQREALMRLRSNRAEAQARGGAAAEAGLLGKTHPEVGYLKERYRGEFARALADALKRASERDRVLLRLQLVNGLSVEKIGTMFGVSQPTASRWLAAARESLLADVKAALASRLGSSSEELASLAALVASRIDLSLSQLLSTR